MTLCMSCLPAPLFCSWWTAALSWCASCQPWRRAAASTSWCTTSTSCSNCSSMSSRATHLLHGRRCVTAHHWPRCDCSGSARRHASSCASFTDPADIPLHKPVSTYSEGHGCVRNHRCHGRPCCHVVTNSPHPSCDCSGLLSLGPVLTDLPLMLCRCCTGLSTTSLL